MIMNKKKIVTVVLALVFAVVAVGSIYAAICGPCGGKGRIVHSPCRGTGKVVGSVDLYGRTTYTVCYGCGGSGRVTCISCGGRGQR